MKLRDFIAASVLASSSTFAVAAAPQVEALYFSCSDSSDHIIKLYAVPSPDAKRAAILIVNDFAFPGSSDLNLNTFTSIDGLVTAQLAYNSGPESTIKSITAVESSNYTLTLSNCSSPDVGG